MQRKATALFIPAIVALVVSAGYPLLAQQSAPPRQLKVAPDRSAVYDDSQWAPDQNGLSFSQDLKSQKKQMVAANMSLTDAEAEKFWPVYDRYAADLAKIYDTKLTLVDDYFENYRTMNGDEAESYIRRRAAVEENVMQLRLQYVPEFRKVLSGRQTALFFQIEWRLDLMINLQLAQAPMIDP
ncbi:MAG TPA: hypothetical protein VGV15_01200 [Terriglobales bacterium]|nr:hypothetical protein [Terriglobales bacterium]